MRNRLPKRIILMVSLLIGAGFMPTDLEAQVGALAAIPAIAYGSNKASDILKQAEQTANNILSNAEAASNRVMTDAALKLNVVSQNVSLLLGNNINTAFDRLGAEERNAVSELNRIIDEANGMMARATVLSDDLDLDLNNTLNRVPLLKKAPLSISRVAGLYQVHQGLPYPVVIRGNGFGLNGLSKHTSVSVFLNGHQLDAQFISPNDKHETVLAIPSAMLEPYFKPTVVTNVALWIKLTDTSGMFSSAKEFPFNLRVVLFPRASAVLDAAAITNEKTWDTLPQVERAFEYPHSGNGSASLIPFRRTEIFPETQQAVAARIEWPAGQMLDACRWCTAPDASGLLQNQNKTFEIDNTAHTILFKAMCNGSQCLLRWIATFKQLGTRATVVPVATKQPVGYGEQFSFELPPNTADWVISGHFYTGQAITCKKGNCGSFMDAISETPIAAGQTRVTFKLRSPFQQRAPAP